MNKVTHIRKLNELLEISLKKSKAYLTASDVEDIALYLDHSEYGLAYDLLLFSLQNKKRKVPYEMNEAAKLMSVKEEAGKNIPKRNTEEMQG